MIGEPLQVGYCEQLRLRAQADGRVRGAWLEGSFGRGDADRYSDLDLHLLIDEQALPEFRTGVEAWLSNIRPLALFSLLFDGQMVNALTEDGLRLDVWLHAGDTIAVNPHKALVLYDAGGHICFDESQPGADPVALAHNLERQIKEFWRCISLVPSVGGRDELIVSVLGLGVEINLLSEILIKGYGVERDTGVKKLNRFLPGDTQHEIERALSMAALSRASLAHAHLGLAAVLQQHGPVIAAKHGFPYPQALEAVVLGYVSKELERLRLEERS